MRPNRRVPPPLVFILVLIVIAVIGEASAVAAQDLPAIRERGVLRVVVTTEDRPAVVSLKPGAPPGFDREMIEAFAALHRLKVAFVRVPTSSDRIPALLAGKGDVVIGLINTEARRKVVDFSVEVFPVRYVAVTHRPHPPITTLPELRRTRVGTTNGSAWSEMVAAAGVPPENVDDSFNTAPQLLRALRAQKVAAAVMIVSTALLEKQTDPELELGLFIGPIESAAWAIRPSARELHQALDEYITNVRHTPTWNRLVVKYYGDAALQILQKSRATP